MSQILTHRQIEIVRKVFPNGDFPGFVRQIENSELSHAEIEQACFVLNGEFLLKGIDEDFEATSYGKEIEDLLDIINRPRLR